jgi:hypothetical protein
METNGRNGNKKLPSAQHKAQKMKEQQHNNSTTLQSYTVPRSRTRACRVYRKGAQKGCTERVHRKGCILYNGLERTVYTECVIP